MSSPPFPVSAILFLLLCIWRIAFPLSMANHQPILQMEAYISLSFNDTNLMAQIGGCCPMVTNQKLNSITSQTLSVLAKYWSILQPIRNTDLVFCPTDSVATTPKQRMKLFLVAGIGFILVGIISILLIIMLFYWSKSDLIRHIKRGHLFRLMSYDVKITLLFLLS